MNRILIFVLLIFLASCANAPNEQKQIFIDDSDIGVYGAIHRNGQLTDKRFRMVRSNERWEVEDQRPDGSWENVTCEKSCVLVESAAKDVKRFMGGEPPPGMWAGCLHNSAFAFCKVVKQGSAERRYVLVGLVADQVIPIQLMRIK